MAPSLVALPLIWAPKAPPALMVAILSLWMPELACGPGEKCPLPSRLYVGAQSDLARDSVVRPLRVPVFPGALPPPPSRPYVRFISG